MNIVLVVTGLIIGGAEKQVLDLASAFLKKGHNVKVIAINGTCLYPVSQQLEESIVLLRASKTPVGLFKAMRHYIGVIKDFKPDVIHSHMVHANVFARVARLFFKVSVLISTAHNQNEGGKLRMLAYRLTDRLADISTNVSQEAVACFEAKGAVPIGRMIPVQNGIDTKRYHKDTQYRVDKRKELGLGAVFTILAVGRMTEAKDFPNLLNAFKQVRIRGLEAKLLIAGDGELRNELVGLSKTLGVDDDVSFLGIRNDIDQLMNAADCFVLSSEWEGLPLVIGEAMASELPVVVTDAGGAKEFVGNHGKVVPIKNAIALAEAILETASMALEERELQGKQAREKVVDQFSLDAVADRWLAVYENPDLLRQSSLK